ncbi:MAG: FIST C-terminal domain-containing protein [Polyangiaceae bacterium]|nr:FIST C-terminal domain-containing protein [Polyangiaceae bacterium]
MAKDRARTICGSGASGAAETALAVSEAMGQAKAQLGGGSPQLVFAFASPRHPMEQVLREAKRLLPRVDVVASSTAGELTERGLTRGGVSVMAIRWGEAAHVATGCAAPLADVPAVARAVGGQFLDHTPEVARHAACVLVGDGLAPELEKTVTELRKTPRHRHPIVGGGAGDDGHYVSTAVGVNHEALPGGMACVQVTSTRPWGVGVAHGLTAATAAMTVTRAAGNLVHEIDGRPALDVYRAYARDRGLDFDRLALPSFLVENELGVMLFDEVVRVRAGLRVVEQGALFFAGEVPEGSSVCIVRGSQEEILAAAQSAAEDAKDALDGAQPAGVLVFSCVCRGLVLGPRYAEEVRAVHSVFPDVPIAGFSSYGEIASTRSRLDGYHNDTIVVVAIPE